VEVELVVDEVELAERTAALQDDTADVTVDPPLADPEPTTVTEGLCVAPGLVGLDVVAELLAWDVSVAELSVVEVSPELVAAVAI